MSVCLVLHNNDSLIYVSTNIKLSFFLLARHRVAKVDCQCFVINVAFYHFCPSVVRLGLVLPIYRKIFFSRLSHKICRIEHKEFHMRRA